MINNLGSSYSQGTVRHGAAWQGKARPGKARPGKATLIKNNEK